MERMNDMFITLIIVLIYTTHPVCVSFCFVFVCVRSDTLTTKKRRESAKVASLVLGRGSGQYRCLMYAHMTHSLLK